MTVTEPSELERMENDLAYNQGMIEIWEQYLNDADTIEDREFYQEVIKFHKTRVAELSQEIDRLKTMCSIEKGVGQTQQSIGV